jgi:glycosyltransferase involved in cell wall biosynthesis
VLSALRVAIDGTSLLGTRTGVGHVTAGLIEALAGRDDIDVTAFAVTWRGRRDLARCLPVGVEPATARIPARLARALWKHTGWPGAERWTGPVDVVHATNFVAPPARAPVIVTIHDLTFARYPEMCTRDVLTYAGMVRSALDRGATVHVVSDFVGGEVREHFGLGDERVVRVYPGVRATPVGDPAAGRALAQAERYVLALGTVEPRKNLPTLVRAFDQIAADHPSLALVVAGPDGWDGDAFATARGAARHPDRIRRLGYVGEHDRGDLLAGAAVFAYPSLYEGFGHPPLEAMAAGVPVVAADAGALPEILGDAALLADPADDAALGAQLDRLLGDDALRTTLAERGATRVARFSWPRAAADFVDLYRSQLVGTRP